MLEIDRARSRPVEYRGGAARPGAGSGERAGRSAGRSRGGSAGTTEHRGKAAGRSEAVVAAGQRSGGGGLVCRGRRGTAQIGRSGGGDEFWRQGGWSPAGAGAGGVAAGAGNLEVAMERKKRNERVGWGVRSGRRLGKRGKLGKHLKSCFFWSEGKRVASGKAYRTATPFVSFALLFLVESSRKPKQKGP